MLLNIIFIFITHFPFYDNVLSLKRSLFRFPSHDTNAVPNRNWQRCTIP